MVTRSAVMIATFLFYYLVLFVVDFGRERTNERSCKWKVNIYLQDASMAQMNMIITKTIITEIDNDAVSFSNFIFYYRFYSKGIYDVSLPTSELIFFHFYYRYRKFPEVEKSVQLLDSLAKSYEDGTRSSRASSRTMSFCLEACS